MRERPKEALREHEEELASSQLDVELLEPADTRMQEAMIWQLLPTTSDEDMSSENDYSDEGGGNDVDMDGTGLMIQQLDRCADLGHSVILESPNTIEYKDNETRDIR